MGCGIPPGAGCLWLRQSCKVRLGGTDDFRQQKEQALPDAFDKRRRRRRHGLFGAQEQFRTVNLINPWGIYRSLEVKLQSDPSKINMIFGPSAVR